MDGFSYTVPMEQGVSFVIGLLMVRWVMKNKHTYNGALTYLPSLILSGTVFLMPALLMIATLAGMLMYVIGK